MAELARANEETEKAAKAEEDGEAELVDEAVLEKVAEIDAVSDASKRVEVEKEVTPLRANEAAGEAEAAVKEAWCEADGQAADPVSQELSQDLVPEAIVVEQPATPVQAPAVLDIVKEDVVRENIAALEEEEQAHDNQVPSQDAHPEADQLTQPQQQNFVLEVVKEVAEEERKDEAPAVDEATPALQVKVDHAETIEPKEEDLESGQMPAKADVDDPNVIAAEQDNKLETVDGVDDE